LGAYAPFGFSVKWPNDAPFRTSGIEGSLDCFTLNPVVAWQIHPTLSIAAGPTFSYSKVKLLQGITPGIYPPPAPTDEFEFEGDNWSYGFNAGLLWQPHPQWSFGASYRSPNRAEYHGDATFRFPAPVIESGASSRLDFPSDRHRGRLLPAFHELELRV